MSQIRSTVPVGGGPTSKERKYDRQLRLWAASGQEALERSRVLLINSDGPVDSDGAELTGVVGIEALKNLVLPGIGGFAIVDSAVVSEPDLGVNFFLTEESLGKSRAEETCKYLQELNSDVKGVFFAQTILELLKDDAFLPSFNFVIVTGPIRLSTFQTISTASKSLSIPLIYAHSVGFYVTFSLQLPSLFPIVETHPDPASTEDLRLTNPWPELIKATQKVKDLDSMDDHNHGHVPYVLLLLHYLEKWKDSHGGQLPQIYKEKSEFREIIRSAARMDNPEGGEENFDEAAAAVLKSITPWTPSSSFREIIQMDQCSQVNGESDSFWIIMSAVKTFYEKHGVLPLPGSLPDMKAQSSDYIWLQNIYKSKARQDSDEVIAIVRSIEAGFMQQSPSPITEKEVEVVCKNAAHIKVIRGSDIPMMTLALNKSEKCRSKIQNLLQNSESQIPIFVALTALNQLVSEFQASTSTTTPEAQTYLQTPENWTTVLSNLLNNLGVDDTDTRNRIETAVAEVQRVGAGELHNVSAMAGGFIAQETVKVLTKQYVPLDNTFVLDGVACKGEMFKL